MPTTTRRRRQKQSDDESAVVAKASPVKSSSQNSESVVAGDQNDSDIEEYESNKQVFMFDGVAYDSYQEMVNAKRKRNEQVLKGLGFLEENKKQKKKASATQRGLKKQKIEQNPVQSRKSSRLSGAKTSHVALDYYVNNWNTDNSTTVKVESGDEDDASDDEPEKPCYFKSRLSDGADFTLEDAINLNESKWIRDNSVDLAKSFQKELLKDIEETKTLKSPTSVVMGGAMKDVASLIDDLSIDREEWVAKVTPDRIYSVAAHPSETKLFACAGDKQGYVGLWDVDGAQNDHNGVHLFHVHSRPVCAMEWMTPDAMLSASYDGTIRRLNVERGTFQEIFATYDDSDTYYAEELGFGLDQGYRFWLQHVSVDSRSKGSSNPCLFAATSLGNAIHLDLRLDDKQRITFNESLSEKKINTLSLHPNGHTLASGGLDGIVQLWDIRKFGNSRRKKAPQPFAMQSVGLSISSAFFSPSGDSLLTTSFADRLDLTKNPHLTAGKVKPTHSIRHNNQTGRWLSTFMATWHPELDIFVCGSMSKPRCMEVFDASGKLIRAVRGESLTAVASRCCFHRSAGKLAMIGGNSSGRVVVVR